MTNPLKNTAEINSIAGSILKRRLQYHLMLRVIFLTILLGLSLLLESKGHDIPFPPSRYVLYFIIGVYIYSIASVLVLQKLSFYKFFSYIQLLTDILLTALLIFVTGGSRSIFTIIYFFPIITASFLLVRPGGMFIAALCTLSYGAILACEFFRIRLGMPFNPWTSPISDKMIVYHYFALHGVTFFLVSALSSIISEKLRSAEAALSETTESLDRLSELYKQIFHDIGTGIITVNEHGEITSFNPASQEITGYSSREIIGKKIIQSFPGLEATKHYFLRPVVNLTRKNGNTIPVGYSWARMNTPSGQENIVYTMQDLSQIRRMEEQVRQAEKMATIGGMAAGIAHEFRNPLASISGSAQFLRQEFEKTSPEIREKLMTIIIRECDRLEKTVDEFLQFSKPVTPVRKWFFLKDLVDEVILQIQRIQSWSTTCRITVEIPPKIDCWADQQLVKQILFNLVENAANALKKEGGTIKISALETKDENGVSKTTIRVEDDGRGISEEIRGKIFEPFFTTRENGTGLGLSIIMQIIDSHGGSLEIRSQKDSGTLVEVSLPLPSEQEEVAE